MMPQDGAVIGWDVGGAHVKACLREGGVVRDVAQWPCPLWQGLPHLQAALQGARERWPLAMPAAHTRHVATMTGEMVDLFADREQGVQRIAVLMAEALGPHLRWFAGESGWVAAHEAGRHWRALASANWRASALCVARAMGGVQGVMGGDALLVDIGSTTTDLIAIRGARVQLAAGADDAARLADGSLVYQGVVRTPLCALAQRVPFDGRMSNVMNEWFATTADVYRLTGELDPAHDQQPTADGAGKDLPATRQRLARMVGRDARDAEPAQWLALARAWRLAQCGEIAGQAERVLAAAGLGPEAPIVSAGCGDFLAETLARDLLRPWQRFAELVLGPQQASTDPALARWVQVAAPAVALALLSEQE